MGIVALVALWAVSASPAVAAKPGETVLATAEIPEDLLLDVGIQVFDPGLPEGDESALEGFGIFPGVRKAGW